MAGPEYNPRRLLTRGGAVPDAEGKRSGTGPAPSRSRLENARGEGVFVSAGSGEQRGDAVAYNSLSNSYTCNRASLRSTP